MVSGTAGAQQHSRLLFDESFSDPAFVSGSLSDPGNARRIATIAQVCPRVETMLDVGCGNGDVLRAVADKVARRYGCDPSYAGLLAARLGDGTAIEGVQGGADHLPFADRAFELVTCCDVLEHLPEETANRTLREIMRVAARYVLINLPLEEDLGWSQIACDACGAIYHREHHQRSYRRVQVEEMLPAVDFVLVHSQTTGWRVRHPVRLPAGMGALLGLGHDVASRCERCGVHPAPLPRHRVVLRDGFVFAHNALFRPLARWLSRDTEVVVLFQRRGGMEGGS